jgi:hypothetical protein
MIVAGIATALQNSTVVPLDLYYRIKSGRRRLRAGNFDAQDISRGSLQLVVVIRPSSR